MTDLDCCPDLLLAVARTPPFNETGPSETRHGLRVAHHLPMGMGMGSSGLLFYTLPKVRPIQCAEDTIGYLVVKYCPFCGTSLYEDKSSPAKEGA